VLYLPNCALRFPFDPMSLRALGYHFRTYLVLLLGITEGIGQKYRLDFDVYTMQKQQSVEKSYCLERGSVFMDFRIYYLVSNFNFNHHRHSVQKIK